MGTYSVREGLVQGRLSVRNFDSAIPSVFGIKGDYEIHFSGQLDGEVITGTAIVASQPQYSLPIKLKKRANL